ncbi:glycosyltransferase [Paenibacillus hamazuiensis]|uniref:glycosyltransferase n=1 Tax=Paenibacillus hamazuiensis TaxID=2936508 RepID=UPI00200D0F73|nr:glycosyltransferase [Paenibacillus hamazuiensis]
MRILLFRTAPKKIFDASLNHIKNVYPDATIDYLANIQFESDKKDIHKEYLLDYKGFLDLSKIPKAILNELRENKYEIIIFPYSLYGTSTHKNLLQIASKVNCKRVILFNDNGEDTQGKPSGLMINLWLQYFICLLLLTLIIPMCFFRYTKALISKADDRNLSESGLNLTPVKVIGGTTRISDTINRTKPVNDRVKIGCIARLDPIKGHRYLFEAIHLLLKINQNFEVLLIGTGPEAEFLKSYSEELGIQSHVAFLNYQADVRPFLETCDFFVLPSLNEAMPISIVEVMAAEKPIIATRTGSIPHIIADGNNGLLINPKSPEELSNAMLTLINNIDQRILLGKNAFKYYQEHFSVDVFWGKHMEVYQKSLVQKKDKPYIFLTTIYDMTYGGLQAYINLLESFSLNKGPRLKIVSIGQINLNLRVLLLIQFHKRFVSLFPQGGEIAAITIRQFLLWIVTFKELLFGDKPDVIHVHDVMGYHVLKPLCKRLGIGIVLTKHGDLAKEVAAIEKVDEHSFIYKYFSFMENKAYREAGHLIVVDHESQKRIDKIRRKEVDDQK